MSQVLELKMTPEGQLLARRRDGQPLTPKDREEAKRLATEVVTIPRAWVAETIRDGDTLTAVKICSAILEDHLWLIMDRGFQPRDELAIYYPEELEFLKTKTIEELKAVHRTKLVFPGARVVQP
jgi:hypothetical protein